jgi:hypothetical protein
MLHVWTLHSIRLFLTSIVSRLQSWCTLTEAVYSSSQKWVINIWHKESTLNFCANLGGQSKSLKCYINCMEMVLCQEQVFQRCRRFSEGRDRVQLDSRPGRPITSKSDWNVQKVTTMAQNDPRLNVRMIALEQNIIRESVRLIFTENLGMQKVCANLAPKNLTNDQLERGREVCADLLQRIEENGWIESSLRMKTGIFSMTLRQIGS